VGAGLTCLAVDAWFLSGGNTTALRDAAAAGEADGAAALIVREGPDGDPLVFAGALSEAVSKSLVGVSVGLDAESAGERRHPTVLARDMTALDLLCGGRSLLCFAPPFGPAHLEAVALCRQMWRDGRAESVGPTYPVPGALNRPRPAAEGSPRLALDLTDGPQGATAELVGAVDFVLRPGATADLCRMERP